MKKIILLFLIFFTGLQLWAQDSSFVSTVHKSGDSILKSKRGYPILPVKGNWSISAGTGGLFGYLGNMFASNNNYNPAYIFNANSISAGYFKTDTKVYSLSVMIASNTSLQSNYVSNDLNAVNVFDQVKDTRKMTSNVVAVSFGVEKRYGGQSRLQRFWGYSFYTNFSNQFQQITYGNSFSDSNQSPTSTSVNSSFTGQQNMNVRMIEQTNGIQVGGGVNLFFGAEYFFAPKMSLGLSAYTGPSVTQTFGGSYTLERFVNGGVREDKFKNGNTTSFNFFTATGSVYFRLFF